LGFKTEIPEGNVALVWDKSGLAANHGLHCLGGVIDAGYRGEYQIVLYNSGDQECQINKGDKIAQLLIQPVVGVEVEEAEELSDTARGEGGFGSTGR
jgi:dUTP pyrophosphatase